MSHKGADQFKVEVGCPRESLPPDRSEQPGDDHNVADSGTLVLGQAQLLHHHIGGRRRGGGAHARHKGVR